ncbi:hypothetical protein TRFO_31028 [Tritrichomonas foetus]|uniref:Uncharacterized protein n=1 Tax=Tritrichomonas foetus TaxID=1144522 RepID=A0A1J4JWU4_9EUKA|nr:hypothetical protein TRFO_31028 [Tritrichomonas foetus]|eukprot:OHT02006.1 hypothetical protein TRFO_31028 [Tritrichomonas foetus]
MPHSSAGSDSSHGTESKKHKSESPQNQNSQNSLKGKNATNEKKENDSSSSEYEYEEEEEVGEETKEKKSNSQNGKLNIQENNKNGNMINPNQKSANTKNDSSSSSSSDYEYEEEEEEKKEDTPLKNPIKKPPMKTNTSSSESKSNQTQKKEVSSSDEYEYEEEEEEEEEKVSSSKSKAPSSQAPSHLLHEYSIDMNNNVAEQIPPPGNTKFPQSNISENNDDLYEEEEEEEEEENDEEEVLITAVHTPIADDLNDHPKKKKVKKINNDDLFTTQFTSNYSEEELEKALDNYLSTKNLPPKEARADVALVAKQRAMNLMVNQEYDKANQVKLALERLINNIQTADRNYDEDEITQDLNNKLELAISQQQAINEKYKTRMMEFDLLKQHSYESLQQRHNAELQAFNEKWEKPETLLPYQKASTKLLQLRRMQKNQAMTMDFVQAKQLKLKADKLQKEETLIAKQKAAEAMKNEYKCLIERQQREIQLWNQNWDRKKTTLEAEKSSEENANFNLKKQLTTRLNGPKIPKKQSVTFPITSSRNLGSSFGMYSGKTRTMMNEYRYRPEPAKLDLRPAEVKAIFRPRMISPRKLAATFS